MDLLHRICRCRSGATAVEFAIVSMVFVLLSISIVEFGRGLYLRNHIAYAADVGTRKVLMDPVISDASLDSAIRGAFTRGDPALLEIAITSEQVGGVPSRDVAIRYPLVLLIPGLTPSPITLHLARRIPVG